MRIIDLNKKSLFESYINEVLQFDDKFIDELKVMFGGIFDKFNNTDATKKDVANDIKIKLDELLKIQYPNKQINLEVNIRRNKSWVETINNSKFNLVLNFNPTYITQMTANISMINISRDMFIWNCIDITAHEIGHIEQNLKNTANEFNFNDPASIRIVRAEIAPYAKQISMIISNILDKQKLTNISTEILLNLLDAIPLYDDFISDISFIKNDKIKNRLRNEFKKHITDYLKDYLS